jgi:CrcB protein
VTWAAVVVGGAVGAACRYVLDFVVSERTAGVFPWGTWTVNILGSLLLGLLVGWATTRGDPPLWHVALTSGFCGAFTTFSTFMFETLGLLEERAWAEAGLNLASLLVGVAAAAVGWTAAALLPA